MASYEWALASPVRKTFQAQVAVEGSSFARIEEVEGSADVVRMLSATNDAVGGRFFIRFIFGRMQDGVFVPAVRDDGIVIAGPNYYELFQDPDLSIDEPDLLKMCAGILKWSGEMRELGGESSIASTKILA